MTRSKPSIARRIRSHWRLKCALYVALALAFCVPYFALQRLPLLPVRTLPLTALDRLLPFSPAWAWVYQSTYLLLPTTAWLAISREQLPRNWSLS